MKLTDLTITKLPGISTPIHLNDLSEGINFVTGPNASGKSSLIRALRYLLMPPTKDDPIDLILEARFVHDEKVWSVDRMGSSQSWRCAGQPADRPNVPAGEALQCHLIRIEDLLSLNQGSDEQLAESIRIELDGGLNLRELKTPLLETAKATARTEKRTLRDAKEQLNQIKSEHRALHIQRQTLPELEQKIEAAKRSGQLCHDIELALDAINHQAEITDQQTELAALPGAIPALTGQELEQLNDLESKHSDLKKRLTQTDQLIEQNTTALEATGLADALPAQEDLDAMADLAEALGELSRDIRALEERLAITQGHLKKAQQRLNADSPEAINAMQLSVDTLNEATRLARQIDQAHARALAGTDHPPSRRHAWAQPVIAAVAALGMGIAAWLGHPEMGYAFGLTGLVAMALLAWRRSRTDTNNPRQATLTDELTRLQADALAFAKDTGLCPSLFSEASAHVFSDAYRQYRESEKEQTQLVQSLQYKQDQCHQNRRTLVAFLDQWQPADRQVALADSDTEVIKATLKHLIKDTQTAQKAMQALDQARADKASLMDELAATEQSIGALYQRAQLPNGARQDLQRLLELRATWQHHQAAIDRAQALLDDKLRRLAGAPQLIEAIKNNDKQPLVSQLEHHQARHATLETLQEQRIRINEAIETTSQGQALSQAIARVDEASTELEDKREDVLMAEAGLFWLDHIEKNHRAVTGDTTMDHAQMLFAQFTHHQWALQTDETFYAVQCSDNAEYRLSELSTATRMQLLLAVRIASVIRSEHGHLPLPLVIDEALATSDAERAVSIIKNFNALATDQQRQIIYLAASDYEIQLWTTLSADKPHTIQLEPSPQANDQQPDFRFETAPKLPEPNDQTPASYAQQIGVPMLDLNAPVDEVHLFYLLSDRLSLLHRLMSVWRIARLGPFEHWLSHAPDSQLDGDDERVGLQRRIRVTRRWWAARQQGHSGPIDATVLHAALDGNGLSTTTLPGVIAGAESVDFDPQALLEHLDNHPIAMGDKMRKLGAKQRQQLKDFLHEQGHLADEETLSLAQCRQQALAVVSTAADDAELAALHALIDRLEAGQDTATQQG